MAVKFRIKEKITEKEQAIEKFTDILSAFYDNGNAIEEFKYKFSAWSNAFNSESKLNESLKSQAVVHLKLSRISRVLITAIVSVCIVETYTKFQKSFAYLGLTLYLSVIAMNLVSNIVIAYRNPVKEYILEVNQYFESVYAVFQLFKIRLDTLRRRCNWDIKLDSVLSGVEHEHFNQGASYARLCSTAFHLYNIYGIAVGLITFVLCCYLEYEIFTILEVFTICLLFAIAIAKDIKIHKLHKRLQESTKFMINGTIDFLTWFENDCEICKILEQHQVSNTITNLFLMRTLSICRKPRYLNFAISITACEVLAGFNVSRNDFKTALMFLAYGKYYALDKLTVKTINTQVVKQPCKEKTAKKKAQLSSSHALSRNLDHSSELPQCTEINRCRIVDGNIKQISSENKSNAHFANEDSEILSKHINKKLTSTPLKYSGKASEVYFRKNGTYQAFKNKSKESSFDENLPFRYELRKMESEEEAVSTSETHVSDLDEMDIESISNCKLLTDYNEGKTYNRVLYCKKCLGIINSNAALSPISTKELCQNKVGLGDRSEKSYSNVEEISKKSICSGTFDGEDIGDKYFNGFLLCKRCFDIVNSNSTHYTMPENELCLTKEEPDESAWKHLKKESEIYCNSDELFKSENKDTNLKTNAYKTNQSAANNFNKNVVVSDNEHCCESTSITLTAETVNLNGLVASDFNEINDSNLHEQRTNEIKSKDESETIQKDVSLNLNGNKPVKVKVKCFMTDDACLSERANDNTLNETKNHMDENEMLKCQFHENSSSDKQERLIQNNSIDKINKTCISDHSHQGCCINLLKKSETHSNSDRSFENVFSENSESDLNKQNKNSFADEYNETEIACDEINYVRLINNSIYNTEIYPSVGNSFENEISDSGYFEPQGNETKSDIEYRIIDEDKIEDKHNYAPAVVTDNISVTSNTIKETEVHSNQNETSEKIFNEIKKSYLHKEKLSETKLMDMDASDMTTKNFVIDNISNNPNANTDKDTPNHDVCISENDSMFLKNNFENYPDENETLNDASYCTSYFNKQSTIQAGSNDESDIHANTTIDNSNNYPVNSGFIDVNQNIKGRTAISSINKSNYEDVSDSLANETETSLNVHEISDDNTDTNKSADFNQKSRYETQLSGEFGIASKTIMKLGINLTGEIHTSSNFKAICENQNEKETEERGKNNDENIDGVINEDMSNELLSKVNITEDQNGKIDKEKKAISQKKNSKNKSNRKRSQKKRPFKSRNKETINRFTNEITDSASAIDNFGDTMEAFPNESTDLERKELMPNDSKNFSLLNETDKTSIRITEDISEQIKHVNITKTFEEVQNSSLQMDFNELVTDLNNHDKLNTASEIYQNSLIQTQEYKLNGSITNADSYFDTQNVAHEANYPEINLSLSHEIDSSVNDKELPWELIERDNFKQLIGSEQKSIIMERPFCETNNKIEITSSDNIKTTLPTPSFAIEPLKNVDKCVISTKEMVHTENEFTNVPKSGDIILNSTNTVVPTESERIASTENIATDNSRSKSYLADNSSRIIKKGRRRILGKLKNEEQTNCIRLESSTEHIFNAKTTTEEENESRLIMDKEQINCVSLESSAGSVFNAKTSIEEENRNRLIVDKKQTNCVSLESSVGNAVNAKISTEEESRNSLIVDKKQTNRVSLESSAGIGCNAKSSIEEENSNRLIMDKEQTNCVSLESLAGNVFKENLSTEEVNINSLIVDKEQIKCNKGQANYVSLESTAENVSNPKINIEEENGVCTVTVNIHSLNERKIQLAEQLPLESEDTESDISFSEKSSCQKLKEHNHRITYPRNINSEVQNRSNESTTNTAEISNSQRNHRTRYPGNINDEVESNINELATNTVGTSNSFSYKETEMTEKCTANPEIGHNQLDPEEQSFTTVASNIENDAKITKCNEILHTRNTLTRLWKNEKNKMFEIFPKYRNDVKRKIIHLEKELRKNGQPCVRELSVVDVKENKFAFQTADGDELFSSELEVTCKYPNADHECEEIDEKRMRNWLQSVGSENSSESSKLLQNSSISVEVSKNDVNFLYNECSFNFDANFREKVKNSANSCNKCQSFISCISNQNLDNRSQISQKGLNELKTPPTGSSEDFNFHFHQSTSPSDMSSDDSGETGDTYSRYSSSACFTTNQESFECLDINKDKNTSLERRRNRIVDNSDAKITKPHGGIKWEIKRSDGKPYKTPNSQPISSSSTSNELEQTTRSSKSNDITWRSRNKKSDLDNESELMFQRSGNFPLSANVCSINKHSDGMPSDMQLNSADFEALTHNYDVEQNNSQKTNQTDPLKYHLMYKDLEFHVLDSSPSITIRLIDENEHSDAALTPRWRSFVNSSLSSSNSSIHELQLPSGMSSSSSGETVKENINISEGELKMLVGKSDYEEASVSSDSYKYLINKNSMGNIAEVTDIKDSYIFMNSGNADKVNQNKEDLSVASEFHESGNFVNKHTLNESVIDNNDDLSGYNETVMKETEIVPTCSFKNTDIRDNGNLIDSKGAEKVNQETNKRDQSATYEFCESESFTNKNTINESAVDKNDVPDGNIETLVKETEVITSCSFDNLDVKDNDNLIDIENSDKVSQHKKKGDQSTMIEFNESENFVNKHIISESVAKSNHVLVRNTETIVKETKILASTSFDKDCDEVSDIRDNDNLIGSESTDKVSQQSNKGNRLATYKFHESENFANKHTIHKSSLDNNDVTVGNIETVVKETEVIASCSSGNNSSEQYSVYNEISEPYSNNVSDENTNEPVVNDSHVPGGNTETIVKETEVVPSCSFQKGQNNSAGQYSVINKNSETDANTISDTNINPVENSENVSADAEMEVTTENKFSKEFQFETNGIKLTCKPRSESDSVEVKFRKLEDKTKLTFKSGYKKLYLKMASKK